MMKELSHNIFLLVGTVIITLVFAELCLRFFKPVRFREPPQPLPQDVWRELLHKRSNIPGLRYEMVPNAKKNQDGIQIITNSYGMRDHEPLETRPESLKRIAILGDSVTF